MYWAVTPLEIGSIYTVGLFSSCFGGYCLFQLGHECSPKHILTSWTCWAAPISSTATVVARIWSSVPDAGRARSQIRIPPAEAKQPWQSCLMHKIRLSSNRSLHHNRDWCIMMHVIVKAIKGAFHSLNLANLVIVGKHNQQNLLPFVLSCYFSVWFVSEGSWGKKSIVHIRF